MTTERGKAEKTFMATYKYGHPDVKGHDIPCFIKLYDDALVVRKRQLFGEGELFEILYDKVESVSTNIDKEWKGTRMAAGLVGGGLLLGPVGAAVGALLAGKKKEEHIGLVVRGQDKDGNIVQVPIVFAPVKFSSKIKAEIDGKVGRARGITI
jgi:hypothetical protein